MSRYNYTMLSDVKEIFGCFLAGKPPPKSVGSISIFRYDATQDCGSGASSDGKGAGEGGGGGGGDGGGGGGGANGGANGGGGKEVQALKLSAPGLFLAVRRGGPKTPAGWASLDSTQIDKKIHWRSSGVQVLNIARNHAN